MKNCTPSRQGTFSNCPPLNPHAEEGKPRTVSTSPRDGGGDASTTQATLSAVIVSFNRRDLVARCLDSLFADPDAPSLDVIVVDNASHDGSAQMLAEQYPCVRVIANAENLGFGRACNQGLAIAQGRHLMVLNQDIVVRPGSLAALVQFADKHPDAGLVGARLEYEDGQFQHSAFRFPDWKQAFFGFFDGFVPLDSEINGRYPPAQYERPFAAEHLLGACLLIRREAAEQVGLFDPTFFMYYEETDLCARSVRAGWRNYYCPDARVMHVSAASTSAASEKMSVEFHRSQAIFYRRHHGAGGYALLKMIVWAGVGYRFARSVRACLRGRISGALLRERSVGYWRMLWF